MTSYFLQTLLLLGVVCAFAVVALVSAKRIGLDRPVGASETDGPIELLGALPLEPRRSVYLLRVGEKVFLVGAGEGGFTKLGELDGLVVPEKVPEEKLTFASVLARLRRGDPPT